MISYIELLETEAGKKDFSFQKFIEILSEQGDDLRYFVEDFLTENTGDMQSVFPPSKNISTDAVVFREMVELPDATYQKIRTILEQTFTKALKGNYSDNQTVINKIIALTGRREEGLSMEYIIGRLEDSTVPQDTKTILALLFAAIDNTMSFRNYLKDKVDYNKYPYLFPAHISAYKRIEPDKALKVLFKIGNRPENFKYYEPQIITALETLLIEKKDFQTYLSLYNDANMPEWVKQEFESILSNKWFEKHEVKKELAIRITGDIIDAIKKIIWKTKAVCPTRIAA
jgi:hypothetical protein